LVGNITLNKPRMYANDLPTETWIIIMSFLDPFSLRTMSRVSRRCHILSNDQELWKRICIANGINLPLIQDLDSPSSSRLVNVNWKHIYLKATKIKERNLFFDLLIRKTSDETLFGSGLQKVLDSALEPILVERCEQCLKEKTILQVSCKQASRVLWDLPMQPSSFLQHTLKIGCSWGEMQTFAERNRVPREFLLDYSQDESLVDLDIVRLVQQQF
jgi:F-box-like